MGFIGVDFSGYFEIGGGNIAIEIVIYDIVDGDFDYIMDVIGYGLVAKTHSDYNGGLCM
jgi:hypothetical protein